MELYKSHIDEVEKELQAIIKLFRTSKDCLTYSDYLHMPKTEEERFYIAGNHHLQDLRNYLWRLAHIELLKVIGLSNSYPFVGIQQLINKLKLSEYKNHYNIPAEEFLKWESVLKTNEPTIFKLIKVEEVFHDTFTPHNSNILIEHNYASTLLEMATTLINEISNYVLTRPINLDVIPFNYKEFDIVKILAKSREKSIAALINAKKNINR